MDLLSFVSHTWNSVLYFFEIIIVLSEEWQLCHGSDSGTIVKGNLDLNTVNSLLNPSVTNFVTTKFLVLQFQCMFWSIYSMPTGHTTSKWRRLTLSRRIDVSLTSLRRNEPAEWILRKHHSSSTNTPLQQGVSMLQNVDIDIKKIVLWGIYKLYFLKEIYQPLN